MNDRLSDRRRGQGSQYRTCSNFEQTELPLSNRVSTPDCSAVRQSNGEYMLGGSQLSLLDKMTDINDRMCNSALLEDKYEYQVLRPVNEMKFSFNKNNAFPIFYEENHSDNMANKSSTIKEVYYKEFDKQSESIRTVQEARKVMLSEIGKHKNYKQSIKNKENLVGSIRRRSNCPEGKLVNAYSKSTLHSQAITENNRCQNILQKGKTKQEDEVSIKCLQQSLAKRNDVEVPLSKKYYLEESSNRQAYYQNAEPAQIIEFDTLEEQFGQYMEILFDQLDASKVGRLDRSNCQYVNIRQEFKIAFGYILIRIKLKDLVLSKHQFVKLGVQTIKQLNSEELNRLLRDIRKVRQLYSGHNMRLDENIQRNNEQRWIFRNKSNYSPAREQPPKQHKGHQNQGFGQFITNMERKYLSVPKHKSHQAINQNARSEIQRRPDIDFYKTSVKVSEFPIKNKSDVYHEEINRIQEIKHQKKRDARESKRLITFSAEDVQLRQFSPSFSPQKKNKVRNISEAMILDEKRGLALIAELRLKVESHVQRNRKILEQSPSEMPYNLKIGEFSQAVHFRSMY